MDYQQLAQMGGNTVAKWFTACHKGKASSEVGNHELSGLSHFVLVTFHGEIFCDDFLGSDASDRDTAFDNRLDDFSNGSVDSNRNGSLQRCVIQCCQCSRLTGLLQKLRQAGVDSDVRSKIRNDSRVVVSASRSSCNIAQDSCKALQLQI